jgi:4-amino-4-deoxy-L-arabinose transferase-like glycosyltransferase
LGASLFVGLGEAPIERAEIYFLDGARGMVETGDWLVPRYRGEPFYDKPPLTYWLIGASFSLLGPSLAAGRLPLALAALLALVATWLLARRLAPLGGSATTAWFAALILGTSYAFVSFARLAMSDMLLTLLMVMAALAFFAGEGAREGRQRLRALSTCGALLGLAFLTKGPIAWIFFGGLLVAWALVVRRLPRILNAAGLLGTLLAFAIGASWFALVYRREGVEPLRWFFLRENLQRFAAETYDSDRPIWYYLATYLVEGLPWSFVLIPAALWSYTRAARAPKTLLLWALLMLVPLSLSRGKIDYYLLPLLPPLSIAMAAFLASLASSEPQSEGSPRSVPRELPAAGDLPGVAPGGYLRLSLLSLAAVLAACAMFPGLPAPWSPSPLILVSIRGTLAVLAIVAAVAMARPRAIRLVMLTAVATPILALCLFGSLIPAFRAGQPVRPILDDIARERAFGPGFRVVVCDDALRIQRDILFELRIAVVERCDLWRALTEGPVLILAAAHEETSLRRNPQIRHIATYEHLDADVAKIQTLRRQPRPATLALLANFATADPIARWKANREYKRAIDAAERARRGREPGPSTPSPPR